MARRKEMKLSDRFEFGKHQGKTLEQIIMGNPTYVDWALRERAIVLAPEAMEPFETYLAEYIRHINYQRKSEIQFDIRKSNPLALYIIQQNKKGIKMKKRVVLIVHTNDPHATVENTDGTQYSYFTDIEDVKVGDFMVLDCQRGIQFGIVKQVEGLTPNQIARAEAWAICSIDMASHRKRLEIQAKAQELMNVLEEEAKNFDRMQVFARMAESSPRINQLMHQLSGLDETLMPKSLLQGLPEPEAQAVDNAFEEEADNDIY